MKWVTDTEAQHNAAVDAAEVRRQSLIDAAMKPISLIRAEIAGRAEAEQAETTRLNAVLDYIGRGDGNRYQQHSAGRHLA